VDGLIPMRWFAAFFIALGALIEVNPGRFQERASRLHQIGEQLGGKTSAKTLVVRRVRADEVRTRSETKLVSRRLRITDYQDHGGKSRIGGKSSCNGAGLTNPASSDLGGAGSVMSRLPSFRMMAGKFELPRYPHCLIATILKEHNASSGHPQPPPMSKGSQ